MACANTDVGLVAPPAALTHPKRREAEVLRESGARFEQRRTGVVFRCPTPRSPTAQHYNSEGRFVGRSDERSSEVHHRGENNEYVGTSSRDNERTTTHRGSDGAFIGTSDAQGDRLVIHRGANGEFLGTSYRQTEQMIVHRGPGTEFLGRSYQEPAELPGSEVAQDTGRKESR